MSRFRFDLVITNFKRSELPMAKEIANNSVKYFLKSFKNQRWLSKPWKQVRRRKPNTPEYKYPKKRGLSRRTRPILIGKGTLRRAVNNSVKKVTTKGIQFRVDVPYAEIHNEGGIMKNGKKMPKRQFMGYTRELNKETKAIIDKYAKRALRRR